MGHELLCLGAHCRRARVRGRFRDGVAYMVARHSFSCVACRINYCAFAVYNHMNTVHERTLFGFWLYILSDCVLFAALFATFAVLRGATFGGPTAEDLLDVSFV